MALSLVEPALRVAVDVTFLRMAAPPDGPAPALPEGSRVERVARCSVPFYRYLYNTVGQDYVWWLRRAAGDAEIATILADPAVSIHVLYQGGAPAGFFELERRAATGLTGAGSVNIAYFGLLPHAVGTGVGQAFLRHAIDTAWAEGCGLLTVNTCTADHPRALPNYLAAGFTRLRTVREIWPVPVRLGLNVPAHLLA
ncbi:GNAT family N-acetyltransferase [Pseudoroseomonas rhizosphaerae]|uniref:GNAT family N-acetyltransferase n=1 Tax=Teichococcus rhizosphaerae TaxID=1335062 RepID=A0A2C7AG70_9PROT|nr:GNAT family N-acetyltransferase [Pseudoroseomonas rhizosphaerae]PHK95687.1 GNAT family N-acetyltransferase [Pseudoroseomonas rhizosphaerae]